MIKCVAVGSEEKGKFFVQTCCDKKHTGGKCECVTLGEKLPETRAVTLAKKKAKELNVEVEYWYK